MSQYNFVLRQEGKVAGQVLGARLGAQSARGACMGRAGGSWAQQALGQRARCRRAGGAGRAAGVRDARDRARQQARASAGRMGQGLAGRQARGLGAGGAGWARGLALGCALGVLGLFSIRFDSVFS